MYKWQSLCIKKFPSVPYKPSSLDDPPLTDNPRYLKMSKLCQRPNFHKLSEKAYKLDSDLQQICSPAPCFQWLLLLDTSVEAVLPGASYNELCCLDRKGISELLVNKPGRVKHSSRCKAGEHDLTVREKV